MRNSVKIVIASLVFFVILVNLFIKNPKFKTKEELIGFAYESKQYALAEKAYKELIDNDSLNIDLYHEHLKSHFYIPKEIKNSNSKDEIRDDDEIFNFYQKKSLSIDTFQRDVGIYCLGLYHSLQDKNETALMYFEKVNNKNLKYLNNSIGVIYLENKEYGTAQKYFLKEIQNNGNISASYSNLIQLYLTTNQLDRIAKLLSENKKEYFSTGKLIEFYFKSGKFGEYLKTVFSIGIINMDFKSILAALFIMIIWMIYLRKIDLFEPEKWRYIILTFFLGIVFSYGTFIISDINNHLFGFDLNGKIVNDFFYCLAGIGLVEETMKLIPFVIILIFTNEVDEPIDYIIYPSISALGFAFAENILYFHGQGLDIIHGRALISVVVHMICSSIIGYGLYFGIEKIKLNKTLRVLLFLLVASICHGFFDFWLINDQVGSFKIVSIFFAIFGLSVWNSFINNALNFSIPENSDIKNLNHVKLQDYLIYGLSAVLIFEYLLVSISFGPDLGNNSLMKAGYSGTYLIAFISSSLSVFKLKKEYKASIQLPGSNSVFYDKVIGEKLRFSKIAKVKYNVLPCKGEVVDRITINNEINWYLVKLDIEINDLPVCKNFVVIKIKNPGEYFELGIKTIIAFFLIRNENYLEKDILQKKDLYFIGWANAQ
jgi:protease PrsW